MMPFESKKDTGKQPKQAKSVRKQANSHRTHAPSYANILRTPLTPTRILLMQRTLGNRAVQRTIANIQRDWIKLSDLEIKHSAIELRLIIGDKASQVSKVRINYSDIIESGNLSVEGNVLVVNALYSTKPSIVEYWLDTTDSTVGEPIVVEDADVHTDTVPPTNTEPSSPTNDFDDSSDTSAPTESAPTETPAEPPSNNADDADKQDDIEYRKHVISEIVEKANNKGFGAIYYLQNQRSAEMKLLNLSAAKLDTINHILDTKIEYSEFKEKVDEIIEQPDIF